MGRSRRSPLVSPIDRLLPATPANRGHRSAMKSRGRTSRFSVRMERTSIAYRLRRSNSLQSRGSRYDDHNLEVSQYRVLGNWQFVARVTALRLRFSEPRDASARLRRQEAHVPPLIHRSSCLSSPTIGGCTTPPAVPAIRSIRRAGSRRRVAPSSRRGLVRADNRQTER